MNGQRGGAGGGWGGGGVWNSSRRMHAGASGEASGPRCAKDIDAVCVFITPLRPSTSSSSRPRLPPPVVERRRVATPKHAHTHTHTHVAGLGQRTAACLSAGGGA